MLKGTQDFDDSFFMHITEKANFIFDLLAQILLASTKDNVWHDPDLAQDLYRVLSRLCFDLTCRPL